MPALRLATTTFVHALVKHGQITSASNIVADALQGRVTPDDTALPKTLRVRFRTPTLELVINSLTTQPAIHLATDPSSILREHRDLRHWSRVVKAQVGNPTLLNNLDLNAAPDSILDSPQSHHLRRSVVLLHAFRRFRYKRTDDMYERILNACLIQGEILTAALLFLVLVKDWQMKEAMALAMSASPNPPSVAPPTGEGPAVEAKQLRKRMFSVAIATNVPVKHIFDTHLDLLQLPSPPLSLLEKILDQIQSSPSLEDPGGLNSLPHLASESPHHSNEALAYLACFIPQISSFVPDVTLLRQTLLEHSTSDDVHVDLSQSLQRRIKDLMTLPHAPSFAGIQPPQGVLEPTVEKACQQDYAKVSKVLPSNPTSSKRPKSTSININRLLRGAADRLSNPITSDHRRHRDLASYQRLIRQAVCYSARPDALDRVRALLDDMAKHKVDADTETINLLIKAASDRMLDSEVKALVSMLLVGTGVSDEAVWACEFLLGGATLKATRSWKHEIQDELSNSEFAFDQND